MTSNDLKRTSNKPVKYRKNKLKGGDTKNGNRIQGSFLIEQNPPPLNNFKIYRTYNKRFKGSKRNITNH